MGLFSGKSVLPGKTTWRDLVKKESKIGASVFGPVPAGRKREFFCLDSHTWVWFEEWVDENGHTKSVTTRYEITPRGIIKAQDGQNYHYVTGQEAKTLKTAIAQYHHRVKTELYQKHA